MAHPPSCKTSLWAAAFLFRLRCSGMCWTSGRTTMENRKLRLVRVSVRNTGAKKEIQKKSAWNTQIITRVSNCSETTRKEKRERTRNNPSLECKDTDTCREVTDGLWQWTRILGVCAKCGESKWFFCFEKTSEEKVQGHPLTFQDSKKLNQTDELGRGHWTSTRKGGQSSKIGTWSSTIHLHSLSTRSSCLKKFSLGTRTTTTARFLNFCVLKVHTGPFF